MIDYKTLVTTEQIDTLEALDGLTGEEISDLYGCPMFKLYQAITHNQED